MTDSSATSFHLSKQVEPGGIVFSSHVPHCLPIRRWEPQLIVSWSSLESFGTSLLLDYLQIFCRGSENRIPKQYKGAGATMEPSLIYDDFMRCEDRSAQLYLELSIRFFDQVDISWFWIEMAMEEKQHAGLLQYCLEERVFAEELPAMETIVGLRGLLQELEARAEGPALNLDDAFDIAIQMETCEMEDICDRLTAPIQSPPYVVQKKIDLSKNKHFEKLRYAAERFGASPSIRARFDERV
jgi:hypothetical protein